MVGKLCLLAAAFVAARSNEEGDCSSCVGADAAESLLQQQGHSGRGEATATGYFNYPDLSAGDCVKAIGQFFIQMEKYIYADIHVFPLCPLQIAVMRQAVSQRIF